MRSVGAAMGDNDGSPRHAVVPESAEAPRHRGPVLSYRGLVSSSHPAVSLVGARILADGGNAIDASLAMAGMAFVALPAQCGPGGDVFAIHRRAATRKFLAVHGSGWGPDGATLDFFANRGMHAIPTAGPLSVAVPGALAGISAMAALGATRPLAELWAPAVQAARAGPPVTPRTQRDISDCHEGLARDPAAARVFLPGGRVPAVGQPLVQSDLAASLERLAADPTDIYRGELAEHCLGTLRAGGAPYSGAEWREQDVSVETALEGHYRGRRLIQTCLPSPGYMLLQQAALLDGRLSDLPWLGADAVHLLARAAQRSFADRYELVGSDGEGWTRTLDPAKVAADRLALDDDRIAIAAPGSTAGDTTSMVCVDANGDAVSLIQSLAFAFGSLTMVPGTGITLNNRLGRGSYLIPGHPNAPRPRRKPMHTLNAWMVASEDGELQAVGNTPGGDGQVQWNMQLVSHLLDHSVDPQDAVEAPRFTVSPGSDADVIGSPAELVCESRLGENVTSALRERGHSVRTVAPWEAGGSAQIIARTDGGCLSAGCDPRQEGCALGV
jgi:gamma-glutamyltranspeptidase/glutathione hydrolase